MKISGATPQNGPFAALRQFLRPKESNDRCELCGVSLPAGHRHLVEIASRRLLCACDACGLLFSNQASAKYRCVPRRARFLAEFRLSDSQWDSLLIPINMAFFFASTPAERVVAMYPGPAGSTESLLALESWNDIVADNPILNAMEPDVEALLVNRLGPLRGFPDPEYYLTPIDQCYRLVGLIRSHWRGFSGGTEVWEEIGRYFADLRGQSSPVGGPAHA